MLDAMSGRILIALFALSLGVAAAPRELAAAPDAHTAAVERVRGRLLRVAEPEGARHLKAEAKYDARIARYLHIHGRPQVIQALDPWRVRLFYLAEDRMVVFVRKSEERKREVKGRKPVPDRLVARLRPAEQTLVLGVRAASQPDPQPGRRRASCFGVHPDGWLLTAAHAVRDAERIEVRWEDGQRRKARVVRALAEHDVALLRVKRPDLPWVPLSDRDPEHRDRLGEPVFTIGYPATRVLGEHPKFAEGAISGNMRGPAGERLLMTSVPTQAGSSGSPLLSESGEVLGLLIGSASHGVFLRWTGQRPQNVNFAVPSAALAELVPEGPALPQSASRVNAIERARAASCLVESQGP